MAWKHSLKQVFWVIMKYEILHEKRSISMENMKKTSGDNLKYSDKSQGGGDTGKKSTDITRDQLENLKKRDEIDKIGKKHSKLKEYTSKILKNLNQFSEAFLDPSKTE